LDFGLSGLIAFKDAPHTNNYLTLDESEEMPGWFDGVKEEIQNRKQLLSDNKVATIQDYRTKSGEALPEIYLFVDAYENSSSERWRSDLEDVLVLVARQGTALGIHLIISAGKSTFIRANILANIRRRIMFTINEQGEANTILGRTKLIPVDRPGAGLVKYGDNIVQFQALYPVKTDEDSKVNMLLMDEVEEMTDLWQEIAPEEFTQKDVSLDVSYETLAQEVALNQGSFELPVGREVDGLNQVITYSFNAKNTLVLVENQEQVKVWIEKVREFSADAKTFISPSAVAFDEKVVVPEVSDAKGGHFVIGLPDAWLDLYDEDSLVREVLDLPLPELDEEGRNHFERWLSTADTFTMISTTTELFNHDFATISAITEAFDNVLFFAKREHLPVQFDIESSYEGDAVIYEDGAQTDMIAVRLGDE
jgi:hypothetical protein